MPVLIDQDLGGLRGGCVVRVAGNMRWDRKVGRGVRLVKTRNDAKEGLSRPHFPLCPFRVRG